MNLDFINKTAQLLVEAGEYSSVELANVALSEGLKQMKLRQKAERKQAIDNMNRRQRRKANRKADKMLRLLLQKSKKPSQLFAELSEGLQKNVLLKILAKVAEQNKEFLELKKDGKDVKETVSNVDCGL